MKKAFVFTLVYNKPSKEILENYHFIFAVRETRNRESYEEELYVKI